MGDFFDQIVYSAANEDPSSEIKALNLNKKDKVLCVSGSGARALDLLTQQPEKIVSIDMNPRQNFLLELKREAIRSLSYQDFLAFLGVHYTQQRLSLYQQLRDGLSSQARNFWDAEQKKIAAGVLYCGRWEQYLRILSKYFHTRRPLLRQLFTAQDLYTQNKIWQKWDSLSWHWGLKTISSPFVWKYLLREPGYAFVDKTFDIAGYLQGRFRNLAKTSLFSHNPYMHLIVFGKYPVEALPLHLQEESFPVLRASLDRLEIVTSSLQEHMEAQQDTYTAFSLSDFSSYAGADDYKNIWQGIIHSAKTAAKVCERFFLVNYDPSQLFPGLLTRDPQMEAELVQQDYSFIYSFNCTKINKAS